MPTYRFVTVDVFTDIRFGGNPLAVFPDARGLTTEQMQSLAREFNYSETTFVLPPQDRQHTAQVRIFTPVNEIPFAGHPNVGTGWVLARELGREGGMFLFEEIAGIVEVHVEGQGATIAAPQALSLGPELAPEAVARCIGVEAGDVITSAHRPVLASTGNAFVFAELTPDALTRAMPDPAAFRQTDAAHPELGGRMALHLYARDGETLRTRMFAPLFGIVEDPATGSANVTLGALLLSLTHAETAAYDIVQGVEMGRPSFLHVEARRLDGEIFSTVGGNCVPVFEGEVEI
jgi:trans-2,3-dihydro-3-hydroxyanthranilate isomerase